MHIYFAGIGGAGIGPLALIAKEAGYEVSGSDKQDSSYLHYLIEHGITNVHVGQTRDSIEAIDQKTPIDWFVYSSALPMENPNHPELVYCREHGIKTSKRDELLTKIIDDKGLKLIAIAGTHGKTTTTAMAVWLLQNLGTPISYLLPAKTSFAEMGHYDTKSQYFVYECDEFDRNFLAFSPHLSLITGIDWDHPDIYPTRAEYNAAFVQFLTQSEKSILWQSDISRLEISATDNQLILREDDPTVATIELPGQVNRQNAWQVANMASLLGGHELTDAISILNNFPGVGRRFEKVSEGLYTDYAHTPPKIRGALQLGHEVAGDNLVVIYEGLHNTRQHFIKEELVHLFDNTKQLYVVPSYLAREDESLELLTPEKLISDMSAEAQAHADGMQLDDNLYKAIKTHIAAGDTVLCLTAGGGNSLDEWLRQKFS